MFYVNSSISLSFGSGLSTLIVLRVILGSLLFHNPYNTQLLLPNIFINCTYTTCPFFLSVSISIVRKKKLLLKPDGVFSMLQHHLPPSEMVEKRQPDEKYH